MNNNDNNSVSYCHLTMHFTLHALVHLIISMSFPCFIL